VVGCDGRHSTVRAHAGMKVDELGAPMDVLWFRLPRSPSDSDQSMGRFEPGRIFVLIDRGDYWQCAYVIPKGSIEDVRRAGLDAFRAGLVQSMPMFADRVGELKDWDQIKLLTVAVDRMPRWHRPGLLCIGDAAHAMSPIGGVGINLAVQDAVAAANILYEPLRRGRVGDDDLARVQKRREFPTRVTQSIQVFLQDRVISRALQARGQLPVPLAVRLLSRFPLLRRIPARLLGLGVRPEHVRTPEITQTAA
jgi:2-polyprenyl-6-methoxyphenol hydroxylase-like FAD-dependent oxidoreductase